MLPLVTGHIKVTFIFHYNIFLTPKMFYTVETSKPLLYSSEIDLAVSNIIFFDMLIKKL